MKFLRTNERKALLLGAFMELCLHGLLFFQKKKTNKNKPKKHKPKKNKQTKQNYKIRQQHMESMWLFWSENTEQFPTGMVSDIFPSGRKLISP